MANVLVATFTNMPGAILDNFRQEFVDALVAEGNNVLLFKTNKFLKDYNSSNKLINQIDKPQLIDTIKSFRPDLLISMNHSGLFLGLAEAIECPIGIWLLDGPSYFIDPEEVRKQASRYHMFIPVPAFREDLKESFSIPNNHIHNLPFASDFNAHSLEQIHNISFIGTSFTGVKLHEIIKKHCHDQHFVNRLRSLIGSYSTDRDTVFSARLKNHGLERIFTGDFDEAHILNTISINKRIKVLDAVQDLGLKLYGTPDWPEVMKYSLELALCFDPSVLLTKSDLENVYNSSKININISHAQARGGLPWRIFDTMSCNGVLVTDYQEDVARLFGKDIPIPIYNSASEAHDICAQLLKDESRRTFIVQSCQQAIESGHRLKHRLKTISESLGINLLTQNTGKLTSIQSEDFCQSDLSASQITAFMEKTTIASTADTNGNSQFSLQLFQSNLLTFLPDQSLLANIEVPSNKFISYQFLLNKSLPFLRLDIGEYFSKHKNTKITICPAGKNLKNKTLDFSADIIQSNAFKYINGEAICGFDSFLVFENPFPDKDIQILFESTLQTRL